MTAGVVSCMRLSWGGWFYGIGYSDILSLFFRKFLSPKGLVVPPGFCYLFVGLEHL